MDTRIHQGAIDLDLISSGGDKQAAAGNSGLVGSDLGPGSRRFGRNQMNACQHAWWFRKGREQILRPVESYRLSGRNGAG